MKSHIRVKATAIVAIYLFVAVVFAFIPQFAKAERAEYGNPLDMLVGLKQTAGADIGNEYRLKDVEEAAYGVVYKFEQYKDDFIIPSGEIDVSVNKEGEILSVLGGYQKVDNFNMQISPEQAESTVEGNVLSIKKIIYDNEPSYEIRTDNDGGFKYIVSGVSGEIVYATPQASAILSEQTDYDGNKQMLELDLKNGMTYLSDSTRNITTMNAHNDTNLNRSTYMANRTGDFENIAVSSFVSMIKAYDFYADAENIGVSRKGINGKNDDIADNAESNGEVSVYLVMHYGVKFQNAACQYAKEQKMAVMYVGDGDSKGTIYQPGRSIDVIAHEYQHAISSDIADISNLNDAGAINEGISDIFGALIEGNDPSDDRFWRLGENAVSSYFKELRNLSGGTANQVYHISNRYPNCNIPYNVNVSPYDPSYHDHSTCDCGGVHVNSTIVTYAQYLMYEKLPEFFTRKAIGTLWYNTLLLIDAEETFEGFSKKMYQTAYNLGYNEEQLEAVAYGLKGVGLDPSYTVTFVDEDGEVIEEQKVLYGDDAIYPADPVKPRDDEHAYEFVGWDVEPKNVKEDMTVTARYEARPLICSVNFVDNLGNSVKKVTIGYGEVLDLPDFDSVIENSENFEFQGWFLDEAGVTEAKDVVVKSDMTIYGKWVEKTVDEPTVNEPSENEPNDDKPNENESAGCGTLSMFGGSGGGGGGSLFALLCIALIGAVSIVLVPKRER